MKQWRLPSSFQVEFTRHTEWKQHKFLAIKCSLMCHSECALLCGQCVIPWQASEWQRKLRIWSACRGLLWSECLCSSDSLTELLDSPKWPSWLAIALSSTYAGRSTVSEIDLSFREHREHFRELRTLYCHHYEMQVHRARMSASSFRRTGIRGPWWHSSASWMTAACSTRRKSNTAASRCSLIVICVPCSGSCSLLTHHAHIMCCKFMAAALQHRHLYAYPTR